eukprot:Hpha_TRINITY_DN15543_c0_g4::TRINITY_DN15543_c0_g4_i1::g.106949::m.106949
MGPVQSCSDPPPGLCVKTGVLTPLVSLACQLLPPHEWCTRAVALPFIDSNGREVKHPCAMVAGVLRDNETDRIMVLCFNSASPLTHELSALAKQGCPTAAEAIEALWVTGRWSAPRVLSLQYYRPFVLSRLALGSARLWVTSIFLRESDLAGERLALRRAIEPEVYATWKLRDEAIQADLLMGPEPQHTLDLGQNLIMWSPTLMALVGGMPVHEFIRSDRLAALSFLFGVPMIDRTGVLSETFAFRTASLFPIPPRDPAMRGKAIGDIVEERAAELLKRAAAEGRGLCVLWSGGIDSTAVLCGLLRERTKSAEMAAVPLSVAFSDASVEEYPLFHQRYLLPAAERGELQLQGFDPSKPVLHQFELYGQTIYVTGECGDQLFGSDMMTRAFPEHCNPSSDEHQGEGPGHSPFGALVERGLGAPWSETILPALLLLGYETDPDAWVNWIRPQLAKSPVPIESTFDFLWWLNFSLKWQHVTLRVFHQRLEVRPSDLNEIVAFFATDRFQQWSMENHHLKLPEMSNWTTYKRPMKDYIFDFTGDSEYRDNKLKVGSLGPAAARNTESEIGEENLALCIDDNFNTIRCGRASLCPGRLRAKYGTSLERFFRVAPQNPRRVFAGTQ